MNQCSPYSAGGRWCVIGDENGANAVRYLLKLILDQVNDLADREWNRSGYRYGIHGKSWKHSFRLGCAVEIGNRLYLLHRETRKKLESGGVTESGGSFSNALAVINTKEALVQKAVEAAGFKKAAGTVSRHSEAYNQGRRWYGGGNPLHNKRDCTDKSLTYVIGSEAATKIMKYGDRYSCNPINASKLRAALPEIAERFSK